MNNVKQRVWGWGGALNLDTLIYKGPKEEDILE